MSNFIKQTKNPNTDEWENANWIYNEFGRHCYGVHFPSGLSIDYEAWKKETGKELETRADQQWEYTVSTSPYQTKFSGTKDEYDSGATRDKREGKGRYDLISPHMIKRLAGVYERGAKNHGDRNWEKGIPFSRLLDSAKRHINQFEMGETDEDHLAQAIWNLSALIHFIETDKEKELNDLPKK